MKWYEVYKSIGTGLENTLDVGNMRKILSFSYYQMPCHLRACLLYLSMFGEDLEIEKYRLISMWIAEGFILCEKQEKSLFDVGESYFNELINRSMIEPIHGNYSHVVSCRVHDMVLDLLRLVSSEENFVTILHDMDRVSSSNTIRRLSLQNVNESDVMAQVTRNLQHARSVVVFPSDVAQVPAIGSFRVLRVLELQYCNLSEAKSLKDIGKLCHLRYLGLRETCICQLPEEIKNLQFLQTLDVTDNQIPRLPSAVVELRNLTRLYISMNTRVPYGIGNLTCLEQLWLRMDDSTINTIEKVGELTELRELDLHLDEWDNKLLECVRKLQKIQFLRIVVHSGGQRGIGGLDTWVAPQHLRELDTKHCCWFSKLPAWMNQSSLLQHVAALCIAVKELQEDNLKTLGRLPGLRSLELEVDNKYLRLMRTTFSVGAGWFPCLVRCYFNGFVWPVLFQQGAMPRIRELEFDPIYVLEPREIASSDGGHDLGLGNLPSLHEVDVALRVVEGVSEEAEQAKAALRRAIELHPNHPTHSIYVVREDSDDGSWISRDEDSADE